MAAFRKAHPVLRKFAGNSWCGFPEIQVMGWQSCTDPSSFTYGILKALSQEYSFDLTTPYQELSEDIQNVGMWHE